MSNAEEVMQALAAGIGRRTTLKGPQGQRRNPRCHAIFTVNLMQRRLVADGRSELECCRLSPSLSLHVSSLPPCQASLLFGVEVPYHDRTGIVLLAHICDSLTDATQRCTCT